MRIRAGGVPANWSQPLKRQTVNAVNWRAANTKEKPRQEARTEASL
jgi:hypothetical protein